MRGDAREYGDFIEETRVADVSLDPTAFPITPTLQADTNLGRLTITTVQGDTDGDGDFDQLYAYGGRSFSIWNASGNLLYDSGSQLERLMANINPEGFNGEGIDFESRSDNKGPEPEGVEIAVINGRTYAFIGLERVSGVVVYDVTDPTAPEYIAYASNLNFAGDVEADTAGDIGPEGLKFIPAEDSPTGEPLLAVASEVSGSTSVYQVNLGTAPAMAGGEMMDEGAMVESQGTGLLIRNFAGDILTVNLENETYEINNDEEQFFELDPGEYTYTVSLPGGSVSEAVTISEGGQVTSSVFVSGSGALSTYLE